MCAWLYPCGTPLLPSPPPPWGMVGVVLKRGISVEYCWLSVLLSLSLPLLLSVSLSLCLSIGLSLSLSRALISSPVLSAHQLSSPLLSSHLISYLLSSQLSSCAHAGRTQTRTRFELPADCSRAGVQGAGVSSWSQRQGRDWRGAVPSRDGWFRDMWPIGAHGSGTVEVINRSEPRATSESKLCARVLLPKCAPPLSELPRQKLDLERLLHT